jgi:hypothetical protein
VPFPFPQGEIIKYSNCGVKEKTRLFSFRIILKVLINYFNHFNILTDFADGPFIGRRSCNI